MGSKSKWDKEMEAGYQELTADLEKNRDHWSPGELKRYDALTALRDPSALDSNRSMAGSSGVMGPITEPVPPPQAGLAPLPAPGGIPDLATRMAHQNELNAQPMVPIYKDPALASAQPQRQLDSSDVLGGATPGVAEGERLAAMEPMIKAGQPAPFAGAPLTNAKGKADPAALGAAGIVNLPQTSATSSTQKAIGTDPKAKKLEEQTWMSQKEITDAQALKAIEDGNKIRDLQVKQHELVADFDVSAAERAAHVNNEMASAQERWMKTQTELAEAKEDPNRYWNNRNGFQKFAAYAGGFFGAIAQGLSQGRLGNASDEMLNRAIDRDINVQRTAYLRKQGTSAAQQSYYGMLMHKLGNTRLADAMLRSNMVETGKTLVDELAQKLGTENAPLAAEQAKKQLDASHAQYMGKVWEDEHDKHTSTYNKSTSYEDLSKLIAARGMGKPRLNPDKPGGKGFNDNYNAVTKARDDMEKMLMKARELTKFDKQTLGHSWLRTNKMDEFVNGATMELVSLSRSMGERGGSEGDVARALGAVNIKDAIHRSVTDPDRLLRGIRSQIKRMNNNIEVDFENASLHWDLTPQWELEMRRRRQQEGLLDLTKPPAEEPAQARQ